MFARTAQQLVPDGTNGLSSRKLCAYCRIVWSELKPEVVLATQQSVLCGTNGLSSSKPCVCCQIVRSELKLEGVLATIIDSERCK